jgi:hypothetical protein
MYPLLHPSIRHHYVPTSSSIHPSSLCTHCFIHPLLHPSIFSSIHHHPRPGQAERRVWKSSRARSAWMLGPVTKPSRPKNARPRHKAQSAKIVGRPETVTEVLGGGGRETPPASPGSPYRSPSKPPSGTKLPLSQAPVHKVTEWRTIQKYHSKDWAEFIYRLHLTSIIF